MGRAGETVAMVYKIVRAREWAAACASGHFAGSPDDIRDGFIHLSAGHQVRATSAKYFSGKLGLVIVAFDAGTLGDGLRWERSRGGELFPHLRESLAAVAALWARAMPLGADGVPAWPLETARC